MITKERLEELIEQGATIYSNDYGDIPLTEDNDLSIYENGQNNFILYVLEPNKKYHYEIFDEDLFETLEEAEWNKEFGCIERTERLELPTWEEFQNVDDICFVCVKTGTTVRVFNWGFNGEIYISDEWGISEVFEYSKEGYTLACRKAKELFLGE